MFMSKLQQFVFRLSNMDVLVQMKINYTTTINMLHTVRNGLLLFGDAEVMNVWTAKGQDTFWC